jgi:hypothetical protein
MVHVTYKHQIAAPRAEISKNFVFPIFSDLFKNAVFCKNHMISLKQPIKLIPKLKNCKMPYPSKRKRMQEHKLEKRVCSRIKLHKYLVNKILISFYVFER